MMNFPAVSRTARTARIAGIACAAILPLTAFAELSSATLLGAGVRSSPVYDGSGSQRRELIPLLRYSGRPWFVRSTEGVLEAGARTELMPGLHAGAQLAYEPGRQGSDSGFLASHPVPDIKRGASVGLQMEWDHKVGPLPVALLGRVRKHLDSDLGTQLDLRLSAGVFQRGRFSAGVFGQAVWADAKATNAHYGIAPLQSLASGMPQFRPGGGWLNTSAGLLWSVELGPKWVVAGSLENRRLRGDSALSPLVERRSNNYVSAALAYRL